MDFQTKRVEIENMKWGGGGRGEGQKNDCISDHKRIRHRETKRVSPEYGVTERKHKPKIRKKEKTGPAMMEDGVPAWGRVTYEYNC
jgi:hypothetical protein